jgi:acyl-CoA synthetase (AMP-forming)/AMP-acid ligase II
MSAGHPVSAGEADFGEPEDIALVLHTSGTTSRPKIVPLSQRNLTTSAANIARGLALTPDDRCLVVMPLFHIHGLIGALLASLSAGASVYCPPGFNALRFFAWLDDSEATWYTAVPTMHQAALGRAERNRDILQRRRLRFIRSSSAPLPPPVMRALEETFGCPVIESYGMTEASHQMASNPLPPAVRKPGTVGLAAGPEVAIMGPDGALLGRGTAGEIVIRGASVTRGYANNPAANAEAFRDGWFRTGDLGVLDAEGYLTINGRLKEIINRGGEKIAPREVDDVLLDHPAVAQAVTFALPHDKLGEDVAAAIVLRENCSASEQELREFVAGRLADFKVPRRIVFLPEIPKGPTGKPQRIGLAQRLGLAA